MSAAFLADVVLTLSSSSGNLASDPIVLGVFFVLGYRKLFSDSSNTTIGSIVLLGALSVSATWFVRSCGVMDLKPLDLATTAAPTPSTPTPGHGPPVPPTDPTQEPRQQQQHAIPANGGAQTLQESVMEAFLHRVLASASSGT